MAKRLTDRERLARKIDTLDDLQVCDVLDYISIMESMNNSGPSRGPRDDDLIAILAEARENKRARQAFEWESVRRRAERRATLLSNRGLAK
jgi:hypothetical protein